MISRGVRAVKTRRWTQCTETHVFFVEGAGSQTAGNRHPFTMCRKISDFVDGRRSSVRFSHTVEQRRTPEDRNRKHIRQ